MSEEAIHITQVLRAWAKRRGGWNDHVGYVASDFIERIESERDEAQEWDRRSKAALLDAGRRIAELEAENARLQAIVDEQAEDEGLWFVAETAPEAYLQQELRRLHAAIDAARKP